METGEYLRTQRLMELIFLSKTECLGCAVLPCLVIYLTLLAFFYETFCITECKETLSSYTCS